MPCSKDPPGTVSRWRTCGPSAACRWCRPPTSGSARTACPSRIEPSLMKRRALSEPCTAWDETPAPGGRLPCASNTPTRFATWPSPARRKARPRACCASRPPAPGGTSSTSSTCLWPCRASTSTGSCSSAAPVAGPGRPRSNSRIRPACSTTRAAFDQNYLQLNSIARATSPETAFYTAFSEETFGPKPWKAGYGPRGKGVVFAGSSRQVIVRGLTCPHSARLRGGALWLCNSGYGELGVVEGVTAGASHYEPVARVPGFTRGLAFAGNYAFVGLSKVIDFYEPYAPGLDPKASRCGIVVVDWRDGSEVASLFWPEGYQIYDVQVMPRVQRPLLPSKPGADEEINTYLRYLG